MQAEQTQAEQIQAEQHEETTLSVTNSIGNTHNRVSGGIVPYVTEYAVSNGCYTDQANIYTEYGSCEKDQLHKTFIDSIVTNMVDFCEGHDIEISSYEDFCCKYYKEIGKVCDRPIFIKRYFIDGEWHEWKPWMYDSDIVASYRHYKLYSS